MASAVPVAAAMAARAANTAIPVVFTTANDPVRLGLVESLSRPAGNMTGATQLNMEVAPKRLEIFHELNREAESRAACGQPETSRRREVAPWRAVHPWRNTVSPSFHVLVELNARPGNLEALALVCPKNEGAY